MLYSPQGGKIILTFLKYFESSTIRAYYRNVTPASDETAVDVLWDNTLRVYFPLKNYGLEPQAHPARRTDSKCNIILTALRGGRLRKVLVIENKRPMYEGSDSVWLEAIDQVTRYLMLAWPQQPDIRRHFAITNVGLYSRFFVLEPRMRKLEPLGGTEGRPFHIRRDREEIHMFLAKLVSLTVLDNEEMETDDEMAQQIAERIAEMDACVLARRQGHCRGSVGF